MELFKLFGTIAINNDEANEAIDDTTDKGEQAESRLTSAFKKIGAAVVTYFAVDKIVNFGKEVVGVAAEVSAEVSAFEQIMGDYSDEASSKVEKIADATGMVSTRLTPYMTSMTAKFKGLGYDVEDATDYAARGLNLAADASAFWDKSLDDSMSHLNSFINGSYEGGEAIGLFANDTQLASYAVQQGIVSEAKEWSNLEEAKKQATRLQYAENMFKMSGATGQAAKEADQYANVQANLTEKWRQFKAQIGEPLLQNIVLPAMNALSGVVDVLSTGFQKLQTWVSKNKTTLKILAGVIIGLTTAIGAFTIATNAGTIALKAQALITKGVAAAQKLLNLVMNANPIVLVTSLIAGLVAAFIYLWNTSEEFREFWINLWNKIKEIVGVVVDWFVEAWNTVSEWFTNLWTSISEFFSQIWEGIKNIALTIATWFDENVIQPIKNFFQPLVDWFIELFTSIWETIKSVFEVIAGLAEGCVKIIMRVWEVVSGWFNKNVVTPVKNFFTKLWDGIKNAASKAWNGIKNIWNVVSGWFNSKIIQPVNKFFSGMWNKLKTGASNAWSGIKSVFSNVTNWFRDKFSKAWQAVKNVFSTGGKIFSGIKEGIVSAFKTVVNAIIKGINKVVAIPFNAINKVLNKIRNISFLGISPFSGLWGQDPLAVPQIPLLAKGGVLKKGQIGFLEGNGTEAVVPLEKNKEWISRVSDEFMKSNNVGALSNKIDMLISMLAEYMPELVKNSNKKIVLNNGVLVGELASGMDSKLGEINRLRERGR